MTHPPVVLRLIDVVKTYPGVAALKGANLEVRAGEVHAVVGENGAGKSTLIGVAAGSIVPDAGSVEIGGQLLAEASPAVAQALGLAVVYQHASVLEDLTVAENLVFAAPEGARPRVAHAAAWARDRLAVAGAHVDPESRVDQLGVAEHQLVEIAKALALQSRVLILDEPTESLTTAESEVLFQRIRAIRDAGSGVVYISHRLPEVKRVADRITVMRDGEVRGTFAAAEVSEADILRLIVGRSIDRVFPPKPGQPLEGVRPLLEVDDLSGAGFRGVTLSVRPGEIVGLAGIEGNGQRDFLRAVAGLEPVASGSVTVAGVTLPGGDPARALSAGVVHLPAERHREGLFLSLSVLENVSLLALPTVATAGVVSHRREAALAASQVEALAIRTPSLESSVHDLSGGNQQKVMVARAELAQPRVLLADEPTRGVDVGARVEIYRILRDAAMTGRAIMTLSSDAIELQGLCDRVVVFSRGSIIRELAGDEITEEAITGAAVTAVAERDQSRRGADPMLRVRRFLTGDYAPSLLIAIVIIALAAYTGITNGRFLNPLNLQGMLSLASALVLVSLGQQIVILAGGFDLSVGPLMGIVVIALSSFVVEGSGPLGLVIGVTVAIGAGMLVGLANGVLVRYIRLAPVLATLATLIVLQGIALLLRPQPGGLIARSFTDLLKVAVGPIPVAFLVAVGVTLGCEWALRRTRAGIALRAVGSDEMRAHRLGARVNRVQLAAYVLCSLFAVGAGMLFASQVGIGDANLGRGYTLTSITAVVLGGASIFGGRGSFVGAFMGALLIQEITTATSFLRFGSAWQYWLPGILVLLAAGLYSRARGIRAASLAGAGAAA